MEEILELRYKDLKEARRNNGSRQSMKGRSAPTDTDADISEADNGGDGEDAFVAGRNLTNCNSSKKSFKRIC